VVCHQFLAAAALHQISKAFQGRRGEIRKRFQFRSTRATQLYLLYHHIYLAQPLREKLQEYTKGCTSIVRKQAFVFHGYRLPSNMSSKDGISDAIKAASSVVASKIAHRSSSSGAEAMESETVVSQLSRPQNQQLPLPSFFTSQNAITTQNASAQICAPLIPQYSSSLPTHPSLSNNFILPNSALGAILQHQTLPVSYPHSAKIDRMTLQSLAVDQSLLLQHQVDTDTASNTGTDSSQQYPQLRSGKWLPAEENYALLLVATFERGMVADCVDGTTTLRTYLSQKLHCAPMRISKKFAGRGIGKLVYSSKLSPGEQQKSQELLERLRIAEQLFLQAAFPPPIAAALGAVPVSYLSLMMSC
jgi:hypothetical protein